MNFEPRRNQGVGRIVIKPSRTTILKPDQTKGISKFMILDAVGPDMAARGLRVGEIVVPKAINTVMMDDGASFRPLVDEENILLVVRDWASLDEFHVQTDNGTAYVPFSDPKAARPLGFAGRHAPNGAVEQHP